MITNIDYPMDDYQNTELHLAVKRGNYQEVLTILQMGPDVHKTNLEDMAPIHLAIKLGHHHLINLLLNYGADIEHPARDGYRPLHMLCSSPKPMQCLTKLVANRVDINSKDSILGSTVLQLMVKWKYEEVEVIKALIALRCNIGSIDALGNTLYHHLARKSQHMKEDDVREIARLIFRQGIDVNIRNREMESPLLVAFKNNNYVFALLLLQNGANLLLHCANGITPLDYVILKKDERFLKDITRFLECLLHSDVILNTLILNKLACYSFSQPYYEHLQYSIRCYYYGLYF